MRRLPVKCEKPWFFGIFGHFWPKNGFSGWKKIFTKKTAVLLFLKFLSRTSLKISERSHERFPRKNVTDARTHARTHARTDETDSIGPSRLKPGTKNRPHLLGNWPTKCFLNILNKKKKFFFFGKFFNNFLSLFFKYWGTYLVLS